MGRIRKIRQEDPSWSAGKVRMLLLRENGSGKVPSPGYGGQDNTQVQHVLPCRHNGPPASIGQEDDAGEEEAAAAVWDESGGTR